MNKNYSSTLTRNGIRIEKRKEFDLQKFCVNCVMIVGLLVLGGVLMSVGNSNIKNYCDYSVYPQHQGELNCIFN